MRYLGLILLILPLLGVSQSSVFTESMLLKMLGDNHPVAKQSELIAKRGEQEVRRARGSFDPVLESQLDQKQYKGKEYYHLFNGGLRVPTWYGMEVKAGFDDNRGEYLNPENNLPESGLVYAGVSVNLGQGLFIDKRRATLRQAQLFSSYNTVMQQQVLNELYFEALKSYWKWVDAWNNYQTYNGAVQLTFERFQGVRQSYFQGDKPAIDTLESYIAYQNRLVSRSEALLNYNNQTLKLSTFLWNENQAPLELTPEVTPPNLLTMDRPEVLNEDQLNESIMQLDTTHPDLMLYDYQLADMDIKQRLQREYLKPKIKLNYNLINEPVGEGTAENPVIANYKWGVDFAFPVFLRKERGNLQLTRIKITETEWKQKQKRLEIANKVREYYNEQRTLDEQIILYTQIEQNYQRMLDGEKQKFNSGESSIFLINSRENKLIEARIKLISLLAKYRTAQAGSTYATGKLPL